MRRTSCAHGPVFPRAEKREADQWEKLRRLWWAGFRFWRYSGYPLAEPYPDELRDVSAWIERNRMHPMRLEAWRGAP